MNVSVPKDWWATPTPQLTHQLGWSKTGLSTGEANARLIVFGKNVLAKRKRFTILERFFSKLTNPLILLLLIAAIISTALRQTSDAVIIAIILFVSVTIDVLEEHTAEEGAEKLRKRVSLTATVLREGKQQDIPMSHIVPGDVVFLSVGDIVPADGRILSEKDILIDQSALTGESYPQWKQADVAVGDHAQIVERKNSVFMGTNVIGGEAYVLVTATGVHTEIGKISKELVEKRPQTEFEKGIMGFGTLLLKTAIVVSLFVFVSHLVIHHDFFTTLLFVLALAIGFAPELLPIVITINLSKGAIRMSRKGVIVKSLPSIENFGSMDTLCTDKTGTLTENATVLKGYETMDGEPDGKVLDFGYLNSVFQIGFRGPMEKAVLTYVKKANIAPFKRIANLPFDFFRKRVTVVLSEGKKILFITKGAPEAIIPVCTQYEKNGHTAAFTEKVKKEAMDRFTKLSSDGFRTLALAYKSPPSQKQFTESDEKDLIFLGFLTFFDPPKQTVSASLKLLEHQGIAIKILTGDNELVTKKVCEEIGLPVLGTASGDSLEKLSDEELSKLVEKTTIFARLNPDVKVRILAALKKNGHVVGFLGDGINDSTAIRASDIGISVDNASDVAKETADIILLHKDLHVLSEGVASGRQTFWNVTKYIMMGISSNFGNMISVSVASVFLPFLPILPIQILLTNLLYDLSQLFVAADRVDGLFISKPRKWDIRFIKRFMIIFGPVSSVFDIITFIILLLVFKVNGAMFQTSWFVESLVTQIIVVFSIRTVLVPFWRSKPSLIFALGLLGVALVTLLLPISPFAKLFSFVPIPAPIYELIALLTIVYVLVVEIGKYFFYKQWQVKKIGAAYSK